MTTAILFLSCTLAAAPDDPGKSWYVTPTGDDEAAGSIEKPFATIARAQKAAGPGDTVFLRGGTYKMKELQIAQRRNIFARVIVLDKSGERDKPITYAAYKDEKPVFDLSDVKPANQRVSAFYVAGSWLRLKGIDVTGVQVTIKEHTQSICFETQGSNNVFERLTMHDGQAIGVYHVHGSDNLFLNCDAWDNWDYTSEDGKGGNVDGFGCHPTKGSTGNIFRGCRAWCNSDDGYDLIGAQEVVTFENCWAMYNGLSSDGKKLADGNGFKSGGYGSRPATDVPDPVPRHVVKFCVAVGNKNSGFYANHHPGGIDWINNTAYRNGTNFNMLGRLGDNRTDVDGYDHCLFNNLSLGTRRDLVSIDEKKCKLAGNSFGMKLPAKGFVSLEEADLLKPRKADGELPDVGFLRPTADSPLAEAGVDAGLPSTGAKPDIGAFTRAAKDQ